MFTSVDETKIRFGDKIFAYGMMTDFDGAEELGLINPIYNSVMGYYAVGGYYAVPQKSDNVDTCLPGFVMETIDSLALETPFSKMKLVDVTNLLSRQEPSPSGARVWMPIP